MRFPTRPTPARLGWPDSPPPGSRPGLGHPCGFAVGKEGGSGMQGGGEGERAGFAASMDWMRWVKRRRGWVVLGGAWAR